MYVDNGYRTSDLKWKGLSLLFQGKAIFHLEQDLVHKHMYWIVGKDFKSRNFYNKINAKENAMLFYTKFLNSDATDLNEITLVQEPE